MLSCLLNWLFSSTSLAFPPQRIRALLRKHELWFSRQANRTDRTYPARGCAELSAEARRREGFPRDHLQCDSRGCDRYRPTWACELLEPLSVRDLRIREGGVSG